MTYDPSRTFRFKEFKIIAHSPGHKPGEYTLWDTKTNQMWAYDSWPRLLEDIGATNEEVIEVKS
jgi:hypothetical protein